MKINYKKNEDEILFEFMKNDKNIKSYKLPDGYLHSYKDDYFKESLKIILDGENIQSIGHSKIHSDRIDPHYYMSTYTKLILSYKSVLKKLSEFIKSEFSFYESDEYSTTYLNGTLNPHKIIIDGEKQVFPINEDNYGITYLTDTTGLIGKYNKILKPTNNIEIGYKLTKVNFMNRFTIDENEHIYYLLEFIQNLFDELNNAKSDNEKIFLLVSIESLIESLNDEYVSIKNRNTSQLSKRVGNFLTRKL